MASNGIKDRVAIIGMGCTKFGEHWDKGPEDLLSMPPTKPTNPPASSPTMSTRTGSARWAPASPA